MNEPKPKPKPDPRDDEPDPLFKLDALIRDLLDRHRGYRYSPTLRKSLGFEMCGVVPQWAERFGFEKKEVAERIAHHMKPRTLS